MDFLLSFIVGIVLYVLGFKRGYEYREQEATKKISETIDRMEEEFNESMIRVKVEKVGDIMYVYNESTDEFMAQGRNEIELAEILKTRYPGKRFSASENNLKEVGLPNE